MRKVAARADISLGNLQYHFATREDLFLALLTRFLEPYQQRLETQPFEQDRPFEDEMRDLFLALLETPDFDACAAIYKEIWAASNHSEDVKRVLDTYYSRLDQFYRETLATLTKQEVADARVNQAAAVLLPMIEGYCVTRDAIALPNKAIAYAWASALARILEA